MTVPLGTANKEKKIEYKYDRNGKQMRMDIEDVAVTTGTTLLWALTD